MELDFKVIGSRTRFWTNWAQNTTTQNTSWSMPVTYSSGKVLYGQIWIFFKYTMQVVSRCYHVIYNHVMSRDWVLLQEIGDTELSLPWHIQKLNILACAWVKATYLLSFRRQLPALDPAFFGCPRSLQPQRLIQGIKASQLNNSDTLVGWVEIEKSCSTCFSNL